jgi:hypothetical protein
VARSSRYPRGKPERHGLLGLGLLVVLGAACQRAAPPSRFPDARSAITRMRELHACSRGLTGEGSFDYLGDEGRVRAKSLYVVARPTSLRFDVMSPMGGVLSTLTSDGRTLRGRRTSATWSERCACRSHRRRWASC